MSKITIIALTSVKEVDGKNKRVDTGVSLSVPVYTPAELAAHGEDGIQYLADVLEAACLTKARNAGEQGKVHKTIAELIAVGEHSGEALKLHAAFCKSFAEFNAVFSKDKKQAVRDILLGMVKNRNILQTSSQTRKDTLRSCLEAYVVTAEDAPLYEKSTTASVLACDNETISDADFE